MTAEEKTKLKKALPVFFLVMAVWWGVAFTVNFKRKIATQLESNAKEYLCNQIEYSLGMKEDSWVNYFKYSKLCGADIKTIKGIDCWIELMKIHSKCCYPEPSQVICDPPEEDTKI